MEEQNPSILFSASQGECANTSVKDCQGKRDATVNVPVVFAN
ncbi:hypothetical protein BSNK01_14250 [Bacillaceae bacterium]